MDLNVFNLQGPEFLAFFAVLVGVVWLLQWRARRRRESEGGAEGLGRSLDPVAAGYLRNGIAGAAETAIATLFARGALKVSGRLVETTSAPPFDPQGPAWERAALATFAHDRRADRLAASPEFVRAVDLIAADLVAEGAVVGPKQEAATDRDASLASVLFFLVAGVKIAVALSRHRSNIWFLVLLTVVAIAGSGVIARKRRATARGAARLSALRSLVSRSRAPADPSAAALMVGAWGVFALTTPEFADLSGVLQGYRRRSEGGGSDASSGGCGSSGGGDGGGGDGGGGGGCGGCGGD